MCCNSETECNTGSDILARDSNRPDPAKIADLMSRNGVTSRPKFEFSVYDYSYCCLSGAQRVLEKGEAKEEGWQNEVDGLLQVLLMSRNQSMARTQHQVTDLRTALRRIEHRLDAYSGQSTGAADAAESPASDDKPGLMREPLFQQQQVGSVVHHCVIYRQRCLR